MAQPKSKPQAFIKVEGDQCDKFSKDDSRIFNCGEYLFVPEDLYNEIVGNGNS